MDIALGRDDLELEELEALHARLDEAYRKLRDLIELLARLDIQVEFSPDGLLVIDRRVESALREGEWIGSAAGTAARQTVVSQLIGVRHESCE